MPCDFIVEECLRHIAKRPPVDDHPLDGPFVEFVSEREVAPGAAITMEVVLDRLFLGRHTIIASDARPLFTVTDVTIAGRKQLLAPVSGLFFKPVDVGMMRLDVVSPGETMKISAKNTSDKLAKFAARIYGWVR